MNERDTLFFDDFYPFLLPLGEHNTPVFCDFYDVGMSISDGDGSSTLVGGDDDVDVDSTADFSQSHDDFSFF